ncbi:MAG: MBL fold metallo-hydrolase RNA specificity domain-containing protein [Candidatus Nanohaloarchaea archaeon]
MIREKDGVHIQGKHKVVADSRNALGDINVVSHAHSDHVLKKDAENVVCSDLTAEIASKRFDIDIMHSDTHESVELIPSGHILGSSAALIDNSVLYTGDVSMRDSAYLEGFKPVKAEELIVETTYGIPAYRFPDQKEIEKSIMDWVNDNQGPLFLYGYSLGKAQKIQHLVQKATDRPIVAHGSVKKMNDVIESSTDLEFRAKAYSENRDVLEKDGIFIGPPGSFKADYMQKLVERTGGRTAGFSGWAVHSSMGWGKYDRSFPLSDHCDFDDLVELVKQVDPEKVYTNHGFDEAFASHLSRELGYNARALKNNQASLTDF